MGKYDRFSFNRIFILRKFIRLGSFSSIRGVAKNKYEVIFRFNIKRQTLDTITDYSDKGGL